MEDPYQVLGLARTASAEDLKRAYRKLSLAWHPDRHAGKSEAERREAERHFKRINAAYVAVGEILRSKRPAPAPPRAAKPAWQGDGPGPQDYQARAINSVVASAALRVIPRLPRHDYRRVISVVEYLLVATITRGEQLFADGFDEAVYRAMAAIGMDPRLRADALSVLDAAADELQWRGPGADPRTWQSLLKPLERARSAGRRW